MGKYYPQLSAEFARLLAGLDGRRVAVIGHARPDGDCIGSQVALARVLTARGLDVICVNADPVPRRLVFLTAGMRFHRTDDLIGADGDCAAIFVDCADHARAGERLKARFPAPVAAIDHHISNAGYAAANLIDSDSSATCEMLAGMFLDNGLAIDAQAAQALFTGIMTDTGQFRFGSATARCFALAGELVARGARPQRAGQELFERESFGKLRLLQHYLSTLTLECGGRACIGTLAPGLFEQIGATAEDTEGLVDYARCIDGVQIGALIEERADGSVKASLRGQDPALRVDLVAAKFNGGGHACAAGLSLKQGGADFRARLIAAFAERFAAFDAAKKP
ncbi:MAG: bifunctional oligoribonuclease/PAP phosphatase NrnA [Opitutaceae bacterium]|nr:bifunctional oligoribonuclease/PAP phosphatase NrnA [Opitutaceae bacterium]